MATESRIGTLDDKVYDSSLGLFNVPPIFYGISKSSYVDFHPVSQYGGGAPIEFVIPANSLMYWDFPNSYMMIQAKIVMKDTTNPNLGGKSTEIPRNTEGAKETIDDTSKVAPINFPLASFFSQVDVALNQKSVENTTNIGYRAIIEAMLGCGGKQDATVLTLGGYYADDGIGADDYTGGLNEGLSARGFAFTGSQKVQLVGALPINMGSLQRLLINGVEIRVRFIQSSDPFRLMAVPQKAGVTHHVEIEKAVLRMCMVEVAPEIILAHAKTLAKKNAKYPYKESIVNTFTIPGSLWSFQLDGLFNGRVPNKVIVGFVKATAYAGDYSLNPYEFRTFDLTDLALKLDGTPVPHRGLETKFKTGEKQFSDAIYQLYAGKSRGEQITPTLENFDKGFALYQFQVSPPSVDTADQWPVTRRANVVLEGKFGSGLDNPIVCVVYATFDSYFEVDASRAVLSGN